jgi:predicted metal-dependent hydrolase
MSAALRRQLADIDYEVLRSRRATADIVIERDGRICVRAPHATSDSAIADIVRRKRRWIYQNLAEWRDLNATRILREYRNGEGFLYLGRSYRLLLVSPDEQADPLQLKNGRFQLRRDLAEQGGVAAARAAFREFYIARGLERIADRVRYFAPKVAAPVRRVAVRELGNRWASYSPTGNVAFHWKCVMAPLQVIDYLVVHELCHHHHRDHTAAFWNEVDKVLPNHREHKEWLRRHGASLDV